MPPRTATWGSSSGCTRTFQTISCAWTWMKLLRMDISALSSFSTSSTQALNVLSKQMGEAVRGGCLEIVHFLHGHYGDVGACSPDAMDAAAANGHLAIVKFFPEQRTEECTTDAMDRAAKNGHLEIVRFLQAHRREGCTTYATDRAAANAFLELIKWIHANQSERCTTAAMENAAGRGHLEIVQFLHLNRSEDCTTKAMNHAARFGNLEVVQWLHANRSEGCDGPSHQYRIPEDDGISFGQPSREFLPTDDIASLHWFNKNHRDKCDVRELRESAEAYDRDDTLEWLEDVGELQRTRGE